MYFIGQLADLIYPLQPAVYLIGLFAVAALGFRRVAGRLVPALLSLLWFWTAAAVMTVAGDPVVGRFAPYVAGACALQGFLLLVRVVYKPMAMPPPVGMSRLWGGLLIGYALVVQPALREWGPLQDTGLGPPVPLPYSLVPLTVGLLLFLRPVPRSLVALPILWAACGGAAALHPEVSLDPGLTVAFLVGAVLLLPRRLPVTDTSGDLRDETWPAYAARTRRSFGRTLLLLVLSTAFLAFWVVRGVPAPGWLLFHAALACGLGLGYWLWLPGWMGPGFRYLAWAAASLLRWGKIAWHWSLDLLPAWLLACFLALLAGPALYKQAVQRQLVPPQMETSLLVAAGAVVLLALLYLVYHARRRLIILEFANYTRDKELDECVKGLSARLRNELAGISALFRTIDEAMPAPSGWVIPVTVGVEDPLEAFGDVVGPDAKLKLWKIEVPMGFLFRWVGRLVGGPRLTGSLHQEGDEIVLVADHVGGGRSASWRVVPEEVPEEERGDSATALVHRMVENLGYRVVTAYGNIGSRRWEAVRHFTRGLRAYRGTQLSSQDPAPDLREAEREFILAMEFDRTFAQCHHNLGVVYRGLQHLEAAEASFRQILEEDPEWKPAYYALANTYLDQKSTRRTALYTRRAIHADPFDYKAWNMSGVARHEQLGESCGGAPLSAQEAEIIQDFEIATALAWRSLFRSALKKQSSGTLQVERYMASRCSTNLSIVRANFGAPRGRRQEALAEALQASREACRLTPRTALFSLIHGEVLYDANRLPEARTALYDAFGDALPANERLQRWMYLLGVQQRMPEEGAPDMGPDARSTYRGFLDSITPPEEILLDMDASGDKSTRQHREYLELLDGSLDILWSFPSKQSWVDLYVARWRLAVRFLKELEQSGTAGPLSTVQEAWSQAQLDLRRLRGRLARDPQQARTVLDRVIETLEREGHARQVRRQGLYSLRARACLLQARQEKGRARRDLLIAALRDAEHSVSQEPESPGRRWILAEVHGALNDLDQATFERRIALRLHNGTRFLENATTIGSIAEEYLSCSRIDTPNDTVLRQGLSFLQHILRHIESKSLDREDPEQRFEAHAATHYWIGRFHIALGDWRAATCSLKIACGMGFTSLDGFLRLGVAHFGAGTYKDAEKAFAEAVRLHLEASGAARAVLLSPPEPFAELLLSWAMTCAEQGVRLRLACWLTRKVERHCVPAAGGVRRRELKALHHECLARIRFQQQRYKASIDELQKALSILETARAYTLLAEVYVTAAAQGNLEASSAQTQAKLARARAERIRRNGAQGLFGVWNLLQSPGEPQGRRDTI